jgi:ankyrin repeat protein
VKRFILAIICAGIAAGSFPAGSFLSQEQPGKLARLIQDGKRAASFEMIRSGADVNEAQLDGTRPVHWAVYRVDYELLAELIAKKAKVDVANEFGYTPLAEAAKQNDARMVKMLMDAGSGTEGANADGQTALMIAIKNGDLPIFQMLIDAGAKVNVVEKVQEQTPLMWAAAASRNGAEMVRILIAKGANVNARARFNDWPSQITSEPRAQSHPYGGLTPLLYAARGGCLACVEALVNAGADVNLPNPEGVTPMMLALDNNNTDVAKFFLEHRGNPHLWDVYGRTALYIAVDRAPGAAGGGAAPGGGGGGRGGQGGGAGGRGAGAPGAAVPAVPQGPVAGQAAGAQPPAGARGAAPGQAGQAAGGRGAGGGAGGRGGGGAQGGRGGGGAQGGRGGGGGAANTVSSMQIINLLLAAGVDPNPQLNMRRPNSPSGGRFDDPLLSSGTTPLLRALISGNMEIAKLLVEKGASPNIYGMGLSPFLYVTGITSSTYNELRGGGGGGGGTLNTELLDLMIKHGADVNAQVNGAATYSGRIARAVTGDPVNTKTNEGMTALHVAVRSQNTSLVRYLLDHGARTDIVDASGRTPLDVLNGATALQPAAYADASGTISREAALAALAANAVAPPPASNTRGGGGARGGNPAAVAEIRTMLQQATTKPQ